MPVAIIQSPTFCPLSLAAGEARRDDEAQRDDSQCKASNSLTYHPPLALAVAIFTPAMVPRDY
jgi:hypothetical protein